MLNRTNTTIIVKWCALFYVNYFLNAFVVENYIVNLSTFFCPHQFLI